MKRYEQFKGMDNQIRSESMPAGFVRNAVNVQFNNAGKAKRVQGATQVYSGAGIHSYWNSYFIEAGVLKRLNADYTAATLATVGDKPMGFTRIGGKLFCGNGDGYEIDGDTVLSLGIPWPQQQPTLSATTTGRLFAGTYQVAITYMRNGEESGCGVASRITLVNQGGIVFDLPVVPEGIDKVAVYCTSVNGAELLLYDEVSPDSGYVFITELPSAVRLETQFMYPPKLTNILQGHYGRLYWADGDLLRWTEPLKYGFTKAGNYAQFGGEISLIVSLPGVLYVCADRTYRVANIDAEGFSNRVEVLPYGAAKGSVVYDDNFKRAFWVSHRGIVEATADGVKETVFDTLALPKYDSAALGLTRMDGEFQLVSVAQGGEVSRLMDGELKASEIARKSTAL